MDQNHRQLKNSRLPARTAQTMIKEINLKKTQQQFGISDKSEYFSADFSEIHGFQGFQEM